MSSTLLDRRSFIVAGIAGMTGLSMLGCTRSGQSASTGGGDSASPEGSEPNGASADNHLSTESASSSASSSIRPEDAGVFVEGAMYDRGFVVDDILQHPTLGDIHFSMRVPNGYDGSAPFALYIHVPGGEGWYDKGPGANLSGDFVFVANDYVGDMIVMSPQLADWHETSADMVIALTMWALQSFNIDTSRVFLSGYSFGGDTISLVMSKRPELYSRVLHLASRWDGNTRAIVEARVPLRMTLGDADRWYSVSRAQSTYDAIRSGYRAAGLSESEIGELVVLDVKGAEYFDWSDDQHSVGASYFAHDSEIMGWLFGL